MEKGNRYLDRELIQTHIEEKKKKAYTSEKYGTFFDGRTLQICFFSKGCRYSRNGSCIICDYGRVREENLSKKDIIEIINEVFVNLGKKPEVLLLNCLGSILDVEEMPIENIVVLLEELKKIDVKVIIFETHYLSINEFILNLIKEKLSNKEITIELGLESSNKEIREKCLNKYIDNEKFIEKIKLIKSFGFRVEANIIFGTPFLTNKEQLEDTINSIKWCFENNINEVDLFPINIKPYTLLYKMYKDGRYFPISHKDFIGVLMQIPNEYISKIHLCWYGNREIKYDGKNTIFPTCKDSEYSKLMKFYKEFNMNKNMKNRLKLLKNINEYFLEIL